MTIKVGQIYAGITGVKIVISKVTRVYIYLIFNDGFFTIINSTYDLPNYWKLIAEYPTWQDAVNSKEFKG